MNDILSAAPHGATDQNLPTYVAAPFETLVLYASAVRYCWWLQVVLLEASSMLSVDVPSEPLDFDLSNLTLVIPTRNRQESLQRTLAFWSNRGPSVLVLDGSLRRLSNSCLEALPRNISYVYGPSDFVERLSLARAHVKTDFVCMHGDDELHLPSALTKCVQTLNERPDLVACIGWSLGFRVKSGGRVSGHDQYPALRNYGLSSPNSIARVVEHMSPYQVPAHTYAVTRSDVYLRALDIASANERLFFAQAEYEIEIAVAAQGKTLVIPQLHWMRNQKPSELRNNSVETNESYRLEDFWQDATKLTQRQDFLRGLAKGLALECDVEPDVLEQELGRLFMEEVSRLAAERDPASTPPFSVRGLYRRFLNRLSPVNRERVLRYRIGADPWLTCRRSVSLEQKALELEALGATVDKDELPVIVSFLQQGTRYR